MFVLFCLLENMEKPKGSLKQISNTYFDRRNSVPHHCFEGAWMSTFPGVNNAGPKMTTFWGFWTLSLLDLNLKLTEGCANISRLSLAWIHI